MKYAGAGSFQRNRPLLSFAAGYAGRMADYSFRIATQDDIQAITDIYNAAVIRGGSSADTTPRTYAQRKAWVESHHDPYAVFVTTVPATDAATEGGERIIGFSALSVFYDRAGYDGVTDLAYYIAPEWQGRERAPSHWPDCLTNAETATCAKPAASSSPTTADPSH